MIVKNLLRILTILCLLINQSECLGQSQKASVDTILSANSSRQFKWIDCSLDTFYISHQDTPGPAKDIELRVQQNNTTLLDSLSLILKAKNFDSCNIIVDVYRLKNARFHCEVNEGNVLKNKLIRYGLDGNKIHVKSNAIIIHEGAKFKPKTTVLILRYSER